MDAMKSEKHHCKHCGSTEFEEGRRIYCSAACIWAAKQERQDRPFQNRDSEDLPDILPNLQDLSNREAQELLNDSETTLRQIALLSKNVIDRAVRHIHNFGPIDLLIPTDWNGKAAPWAYYVRGRIVEVFALEGLTLKEKAVDKPHQKSPRIGSPMYPAEIRAKAVQLYEAGYTGGEVSNLLGKLGKPSKSTVLAWLRAEGKTRRHWRR